MAGIFQVGEINWQTEVSVTADFMEVSKFPRKALGAMHAQTMPTRYSFQFFNEAIPATKQGQTQAEDQAYQMHQS